VTDKKNSKKRNYSFVNRNPEGLDSVEGWNGEEFIIPATPGTWYWAILKFCYINHDTVLSMNDIIDGAAEIYSGRDFEKFQNYKNKKVVRTVKKGVPIERTANDWRDRVATNVKTLTRHGGNNPYGQRLLEKGHMLKWEKQNFILKTTNAELNSQPKKEETNFPILTNSQNS